VARGKAFEAATVLHGMELSEDEVKVTVEDLNPSPLTQSKYSQPLGLVLFHVILIII